MAADIVRAMASLGHDRFALVGHDRGALVAFRAGLDHPETITHLGILDVVPTLDMWNVLHGVSAAVAHHLYLMAQPPGLPETMIANSADAFFGSFLDAWTTTRTRSRGDPRRLPARERRRRRLHRRRLPRLGRHRRPARPGRPRRRLPARHARHRRPAGLGQPLGYDAAGVWRAWSPDLDHRLTRSGHFMAEESPEEITGVLRALLAR